MISVSKLTIEQDSALFSPTDEPVVSKRQAPRFSQISWSSAGTRVQSLFREQILGNIDHYVTSIKQRKRILYIIGGILFGIPISGLVAFCIFIIYQHMLGGKDILLYPCDDFYAYACAWWNGGHSLYGCRTTRRTKSIIMQTKKILESSSDGEKETLLKKAKIMYAACLDEESANENGMEILSTFLNSTGGWPIISYPHDTYTTEAVSYHLGKLHQLGTPNGMFSMRIVKTENSSPVLKLQYHKMTTGEMIDHYNDIYLKTSLHEQKELAEYILSVIRHFGGDDSTKTSVDDMVELEMHIHKCSQFDDNQNTEEEEISLIELENIIQLKWHTYISNAFHEIKDMPEVNTIIVNNKQYFTKLGVIINRSNPRTILNYAIWKSISTLLWHSTKYLNSLTNKYLGRKRLQYYLEWRNTTRDIDIPNRSNVCAETVIKCFPLVMLKAYTGAYLSTETIQAVDKVTTYILKALELKILDGSFLLSSENEKRIFNMINTIKKEIGMFSWATDDVMQLYYDNLKIEMNSHLKNVLQCMKTAVENLNNNSRLQFNILEEGIAYDDATNTLSILDGFIQPPIFSTKHLYAMNFATFGTLVGYVLLNKLKDYQEMHNMYSNKSEHLSCYKHKYQEFCPQHIKRKQLCKISKTSLQDLIATDGGIQIALTAFKMWQKHHKCEEDKTQISIITYNLQQLFFLSHSLMWCLKISPFVESYFLKYKHQCPPNMRLNIAFSNIPEFSAAFRCNHRHVMNATSEQCTPW